MALKERGQRAGGKRAVWLYSVKVRWFWMRSLPDTRRSKGYLGGEKGLVSGRCRGMHCALGAAAVQFK